MTSEGPVVGQSSSRVDARAKVTGAAVYPGDLSMEGMLHAKALLAGRPHARILDVETTAAEALPGVVAILTARDVPVNEYGLQTPDQPVLCGPGSGKPGADVVRFVGDQVALVVAETDEIAARARNLIRVEFEDLPVISDPFAALQPNAPCLHPHRQPSDLHPELSTQGNVICHHQIRKGAMAAGWAAAEVTVEAEYHTPAQEHAYLQPEAGLAYIDEAGRLTVEAAGQWTWEDQQQIAHALALPPERVRVIYPAIGGPLAGARIFGADRAGPGSLEASAPVKIVWTREESILGHCKRHPVWLLQTRRDPHRPPGGSRDPGGGGRRRLLLHDQQGLGQRLSPAPGRTRFQTSRLMSTVSIPTILPAGPFAALAHHRPSSPPKCR